MKKRIINIAVSFDMTDIPTGSTITPKEKVKEAVEKEMAETFGDDEGFRDLRVDIIDIEEEDNTEYDDEYDNYPCSTCASKDSCDGWEAEFCCTLCHYYNDEPDCEKCDPMDI